MTLLSTLRRFIARQRLLPDDVRVVVGVSGGPDSLALLHTLTQLASAHGWTLHAAYLNHGLRPEAEAEAHFVAEQAAAWGLGCTIEREDVAALAAAAGLSVEEAARQARYRFLGRTARRLAAPVVAVGHHADDQVETILMHLLRGSGLAGLRGMPPAVALDALRLPGDEDYVVKSAQGEAGCGDVETAGAEEGAPIMLVRPLLPFTRDEILAYCRAQGLDPRWDASNQDVTFFRNRLRHELIPQLRAINPQLAATLGRTAFALQGDYDTLQDLRQALWRDLAHTEPGRVRLPLVRFRQLAVGEQRALLRRAIAHLRPEHRNIGWEHTERLLDVLAADAQRASGGPYTLTAGLQAWLSYEWLDVQQADFIPFDAPQAPEPQQLALPGAVHLGPGWELIARQVQWPPGEPPWLHHAAPQVIWLPVDVAGPLQVRPRRPGDRMTPLGLGAEKSIKDLMNALKIPRVQRPHWPLLTDARGRILWLVGRRASELTRLPPEATRAWEVRLQQSPG